VVVFGLFKEEKMAFLETRTGELLNMDTIVKIVSGEVCEGQRTAYAHTRDDEQIRLKYHMGDLKRMLAPTIPAASGFYLVELEQTQVHAIVAWRMKDYGLEPVTISGEIELSVQNSEFSESHAIQYPDGRVVDGMDTVYADADQWRASVERSWRTGAKNKA
jgi:hypothetical protein